MTEGIIRVEELDTGLRAAFINMPHFRTTSARLTINSGSLHESLETAGAAHFLEHITFQGTAGLPTEEDVHRYTEENGLSQNAFTNQTYISYIADGHDLESVGYFVTQTALVPTLLPEALERERNPIIDEIRGYASNPHYLPSIAHSRAVRGDRYARPIVGTIEDVAVMTHEHLTDYHSRNYKLGNAVLVVCSSEPIKRQREYVEFLTDNLSIDGVGEPTPIELPDFNPDQLTASLQIVDLPPDAQTSLSINYGLPETRDLDERFSYNTIAHLLSKTAHRRLRSEMALCYGAQASTIYLANLNFGASQRWSHISVSANLNGEDSTQALDAMLDDVILKDLSSENLEAVRRSMRNYADEVMESNPAVIANLARDILAANHREEIDLEEVKAFADRVSLEALQKMHRDITDTPPLVLATSPDPMVLEAVGDWATSRIVN